MEPSNGHCTRNGDEYAKVFNEGCDARLRGVPIWENPYTYRDNHSLHLGWKLGWEDVDRWWASESLNWDTMELPAVVCDEV